MKPPTITHLFYLFALCVICTSCATILNKANQSIYIIPGNKVEVLSVTKESDSLLSVKGSSFEYYVKRNDQPLLIHLKVDSTEKTFTIKAKKSPAYWLNIYANYGLGMLIDKKSDKRYCYPSSIHLSLNDTVIKASRFSTIKKGTIDLTISLPLIQAFNIKTDKRYNSAGIWGIEAGANYFYQDDHYLSFRAGAGTDAFVEHFGKGYFNRSDVLFTSVRNNYTNGSFDIGYGLHISKFIWHRFTLGDTINLNKRVTNTSLGASLAASYRVGNSFRAGLLYQPALFDFSHSRFSYQHYLSLNIGWRIPVRRRL